MMFVPHPPPMPNEVLIESEGSSKQQDMRKDYGRLPRLDRIVAILIIVGVITAMILMDVFHLF